MTTILIEQLNEFLWNLGMKDNAQLILRKSVIAHHKFKVYKTYKYEVVHYPSMDKVFELENVTNTSSVDKAWKELDEKLCLSIYNWIKDINYSKYLS